MIKSKLRLFGWAVGLSLALGAVGAVAAQGAPAETQAVAAGDVFERISTPTALSDGDEVIFVNQAETYACGTTQNTNNRTPVSISVSSHKYTYAAADNVQVFTVKKNNDGKFGFHTGSGYIYSASSSNNNLKTNTTAASTAPSGTAAWTLSISNYVVSATNVSNTSYYLAFNGTSYFSQYKSSQIKPYIFKKLLTQTVTPSQASAYSDETITMSSTASTTVTWSVVVSGTTAPGAAIGSSSGVVSVTGAGNVKVKASASGYNDAEYVVTFNTRPAGNYYDVTFNSNGGSITPTKKIIAENATFTFPSPGVLAHHDFTGWSSDEGKTLYAEGATSPAVTADREYVAYWEEHNKVNVSYIAGDHGSGESSSLEYVGDYILLSLSNAGLAADSGYRLKHYSVVVGDEDATTKKPGDVVTLTASATITAIFEVEPTQITIAFTGSTTGNMDGTNQAESVFGLDSDVWSVKGIKNAQTNNVGLNANSPKTIRLYANKGGGDGNAFEVEALDEAIFVTNVALTLAESSGSNAAFVVKKVVGNVETVVEEANDVYLINASKFFIKNITTADNSQVHIESLAVEFDYVSSFKKARAFENQYVFKGVPYTDGSKGTNCLTWYGEAIEAYNDNTIMGSEARIWFASRSEFANARARLIAWALENKVHLSFNSQTGDLIYSAGVISALRSGSDSARTPLLVAAFAGIGALAVGGMVFLRKRKEF